MRFDGERHLIQGSVAFPDERGEVTFALDTAGDLTSSNWSGSLGISAKRVDLGLLEQQKLARALNASGRVSFDLQSRWVRGRLRKAQGVTTLEGVTLGHEAWATPVEHGSNRFSLERDDRGWDLYVDEMELRTANGTWPRSSASFRLDTSDKHPRLSGIVEFAKLEDILPLVAAVTPASAQQIDGIRARGLHGELVGTEFSMGLNPNEALAVELHTDVNRLGVAPAGPLPGFTGVSGRVESKGWEGRFELRDAPVEVSWTDAEQRRAVIGRTAGVIRWKRRGTGIWLNTAGVRLDNDYLRLAVAGQIHLPPGTSDPIVDLGVRVRDADIARVLDAIPIDRLMPRPGKWAQRALRSGTVTDAELLYRGRASRFPFDGAKDGLGLRLRFDEVELEFMPTWPVVDQLAGEMSMNGPEVVIEVAGARTFDNRVGPAQVRIEELGKKHPLMTLTGWTTAPTQRLLNYLAATPLRSRFGRLIEDIQSKGAGVLSLQLRLPLGTKQQDVNGQVQLKNNTVDFQRLGLGFSKVNGRLDFSNAGVSTKAVRGEYLGQPVLATAYESPHSNDVTRVELTGTADPSFMERQLRQLDLLTQDADPAVIASRFTGTTEWQAVIDLPKSFGRDPAAVAHLRVRSALQGMGVTVPSPFAKTQRDVRRLDILTAFRPTPMQKVTIRYGDARAVFELNKGTSHRGSTAAPSCLGTNP